MGKVRIRVLLFRLLLMRVPYVRKPPRINSSDKACAAVFDMSAPIGSHVLALDVGGRSRGRGLGFRV